jgi:hypothetical protein
MAGMIAAVLAITLTMTAGAVQFSETNKDIDIVYGDFAGYRFHGPDAPIGDIDTSRIATVKFYIKCPDLEDIDEAMVQLVFNSGTTGWVEIEHDLNDGLIVEMDVPGVVDGDYFDAALATWDEGVWGTFSVEVLDVNGEVIGVGVYSDNVHGANEENEGEGEEGTGESTEETEPPEESSEPPPEETNPPEESNTTGTGTEMGTATDRNVPTGVNIITAMVMTALSGFAIASMRKKSKDS